MTITITSLNRENKTKSTGIRPKKDELKQDYVGRAIKKLYGKNCFWFGDHSMPDYGQVFEVTKYGNSSRTGKMRIDIE